MACLWVTLETFVLIGFMFYKSLPLSCLCCKVRGQHYDLVVNGWELGGGSMRIHQPELQQRILTDILKCGTDQFNHLMNGLRSGCPPHGGIALGRYHHPFNIISLLLCIFLFPSSSSSVTAESSLPLSSSTSFHFYPFSLLSPAP